ESKGVVRLLAEPNLTTVSGETASFNAGGEVPIRSVNAQGEVEIVFKQFGVNLNFTPIVLDDGKIHIKLAPEVSDLTGFTAASDPELFLLGQLEVSKDMIRKYEHGDGVTGPYGHMLDVKSKDKLVYVKK